MSSHSEHVLQQLCSQLEYGFLCDCSIAVGDVRFRAHRVVLAACSSYFHKLFVNQPAESSLVALSPQAVSPDHFDLILQLMYTGRLGSPPADPERFHASLRFLKLYNAGRFLPPGDRNAEEASLLASTKPLVFGVQLYPERAASESLGPANESLGPANESLGPTNESLGPASVSLGTATCSQVPVAVKAENPEEASDQRAGLGSVEEEQPHADKEHPRPQAECPFFCPLCGLAFERAQRLQDHLSSCCSGPFQHEPAIKREEEEAERPSLDGRPREGGHAEAEEGGCRPWAPEGEDYELEEGEVRFPGDDDLVLENATDDSFSSTESSLEGDGEGSGRSEPSEEEAGGGGPSEASLSSLGLGRSPCQAARRRGKAWSCQACEGCCLAEERSWGRSCKKKRLKRRSKEGEEPAAAPSALLQEAERPQPAPKLVQGPGELAAARGLSERLACPAYARAFPWELRMQLAGRAEGVVGGARFGCTICGYRSRRKHAHLRHLASHLLPGQAVCQVCFEIVGSKGDLQQHLESHLYSCGVCGQKFRLKKDMVAHANSCWSRKLHGRVGRFGSKSKN
ncbi:zinc finger and BTB domain-containing protein 1-like [Mobula hypostoma]|uniref:zinc finger and BTB domain-containing protein 1-like n=1 Tax=Mobula hypostoma TaxID=723540 RepID=UPI002FC304B1